MTKYLFVYHGGSVPTTPAEQARGRYVRLADRAARMYAPAVHVLGLTTFIGWMIAGQGWETALTAAIAVLIITCPCALALAVPAVQVAASSRLFGKGILLKAADGLERLAEIDTVVFDKTGTITLGEPELVAPESVPHDVLARAASLAAASRHPFARAVVRAAEAAGLKPAASAEVRETAGLGLERVTDAGSERLGSAVWCGFTGASDFGGGVLTSEGDHDIFAVKLTPAGAHVWSKRFGDFKAQDGIGAAGASTGAVAITGGFIGGLNLGGGPATSKGGYDGFLAVYGP